MDCIFCKITNNEIPSYTVYEDEIVKVFLDINPKVDGDMLIVPKKHFTDIMDIDFEVLKHVSDISRNMYQLLKDKLHVDGLTTIQNNGCASEVKHFHVHLTPRYNNDGVETIYPNIKSDVKEVYEKIIK
jgi:histidine triad (HIT) family protein